MKKRWKGALIGGIVGVMIILLALSFVSFIFLILFLISIPIILSVISQKFIGSVIGGLLGIPILTILNFEQTLIAFFNIGHITCEFFQTCGVVGVLLVNVFFGIMISAIIGLVIEILIRK